MGNMSYCMFENTFKDLQQAYEEGDWESNDLNEYELKFREKLIKLCHDIVESYGGSK